MNYLELLINGRLFRAEFMLSLSKRPLNDMDTHEARQLLQSELAEYEKSTYAELVRSMGEDFHFEKQAPSGTHYQIEILITWDSTPNEAIRIIGSIDDGGWRAFVPLTESILKFPEN